MSSGLFLSLMQNFSDGYIEAELFCTRFMELWKQERDKTYLKREEWPQPYDKQLIAAFQQGDLSSTEFSEQWTELWGYDAEAQTVLDSVFTACDCWYPYPEREWEIDEVQLRHEVEEAYATLTQPNKVLVQAA